MKPSAHPFSARLRGTTLIEAMCALAILAFGMTGFTTAMIASAQQDRRNSARAAAKQIADELAGEIGSWEFADSRLNIVNYTSPNNAFSDSTATGGTVTIKATGPASTIVGETLSSTPDYTDASLATSRVRPLSVINAEEPGRTYVFNRYWNVMLAPGNPSLKIVAVYVTYGARPGMRDVITTFVSVVDSTAFDMPSFGAF